MSISFTDKLKKFTSEAVEVGKKLTSDAVEKGKGLAEQGKLALDNQKQQDVIKQAKIAIGNYVAESQLLAEDEFVGTQLAAIAEANAAIAANNARIAELKTADADEEAEAEFAVSEEEAPAEGECCCKEEAPAEGECCCKEEAPAGKTCPVCGAAVAADARFCSLCGEKLL